MHQYLMNNKHFGPTLRNYYEHRGIRSRTRIFAITLMWSVLIAAIILFIPFDWAKISVIIIGIVVSLYLIDLKTVR